MGFHGMNRTVEELSQEKMKEPNVFGLPMGLNSSSQKRAGPRLFYSHSKDGEGVLVFVTSR